MATSESYEKTAEEFKNIFINVLENKYNQKQNRNIWENSSWKHIAELENDDVGKVGESTIHKYLQFSGIDCNIDGSKTKELGGGCGDGFIKGHSVEIKTARLGSSNSSFQHELGEKPWIAEYMLFLDIAPNVMYITLFKNFTQEKYIESGTNKNVKCDPVFPTKSICWRKKQGAFKLDTTLAINETNKYTFKIDDSFMNENKIDEFRDFINSIIQD